MQCNNSSTRPFCIINCASFSSGVISISCHFGELTRSQERARHHQNIIIHGVSINTAGTKFPTEFCWEDRNFKGESRAIIPRRLLLSCGSALRRVWPVHMYTEVYICSGIYTQYIDIHPHEGAQTLGFLPILSITILPARC